jgi:hypothetical protein
MEICRTPTTSSALSLSKHKRFALVGSAILIQTALMKIGFIFGESVAAGCRRRSTIPYLELRDPVCRRRTAGAMLVDTQLAFLPE